MDMTAIYPNVVNLVMVIVLVAMVYTGGRRGVIVEGFQLFGIFCSLFFTVHYYGRFADFLRVQFFGKETSTELIAFTLLGIWIYAVFVLIGKGWVLILKIEVRKKLDLYGGGILALMQGYFMCGMIFFALLLTNNASLYSGAQNSASSRVFRYVAVDFYRAGYSGFVAKIFKGEPFNQKALDVVLQKKKR
jgi:uncharacterized membrane protein required for colicin V production